MELGFVEKVDNPEEISNPFHTSKVGGKPAWLDFARIPSTGLLTCSLCGKPLIHLLQIQSSPHTSCNKDRHRTLYLFLCTNPDCYSSEDSTPCFMALRCELEVVINDYESPDCLAEPNDSSPSNLTNSEEDGNTCIDTEPTSTCSESNSISASMRKDMEISTAAITLCIVCGGSGPSHCGSCKVAHYCSRTHQLHDWRVGHKEACSSLAQGQGSLHTLNYDPSLGVLLPELEIVTELESLSCQEGGGERSEDERMQEYHEYMRRKEWQGQLLETGGEELEKAATASEDKLFQKFKERISAEPSQVW